MNLCCYEPRYPPEWETEAMNAVDEEYEEIPRWLEPEDSE